MAFAEWNMHKISKISATVSWNLSSYSTDCNKLKLKSSIFDRKDFSVSSIFISLTFKCLGEKKRGGAYIKDGTNQIYLNVGIQNFFE